MLTSALCYNFSRTPGKKKTQVTLNFSTKSMGSGCQQGMFRTKHMLPMQKLCTNRVLNYYVTCGKYKCFTQA